MDRHKRASVTFHGEKRARKRLGISKSAVVRNVQYALANGITHQEAYGSLKKYVDYLWLSHRTANNIRIYNRYVYIFIDTALVTVFPLPRMYWKQADTIQNGGREGGVSREDKP